MFIHRFGSEFFNMWRIQLPHRWTGLGDGRAGDARGDGGSWIYDDHQVGDSQMLQSFDTPASREYGFGFGQLDGNGETVGDDDSPDYDTYYYYAYY